ncbi:hypothetical protein BJ138DRAFT_1074182 [Hygrophoropsis aurantiaca]|uniref:Uncharacterized protein n=1 Tax=Hygrophoropsis aurantiaca TaxID=72124 RepID=A0ACB7ZRK5_9AGAM|nr:hypothetical protein BJ138DRAFT_1074182 [Hygrophoropsis aurantiaca]
MPKDLWRSEVKMGLYFKLTLCRPISLSDWAVLQKYTRRVRYVRQGPNRHLYISTRERWTLDDAFLLALCAASAPTPLLPNLKSLKWNVSSDAHLSALHRLVSPSLTSLDLNFWAGALSLDLNTAVQFRLEEVFPSLKSLVVGSGTAIPPSLLRGLQSSILPLQNLVTIDWNDLRSDTIMSLSQLPALREATFSIPSDFSRFSEILPPHLSKRKGFSNLRNLCITCDTPASLLSFVSCFTFNLDFVFVKCGPLNPSQIGDLFMSLVSSPSHSMQAISVHGDKFRSLEESWVVLQPPLSMRELRPLLQFKELQHLYLNIQCHPIALNDMELLEMADAWPNLIGLRLEGFTKLGSHVTPYALIALFDRCPKLRVDFEPSSIPNLLNIRNRQYLGYLYLGWYNIAYPDAIARFLACFVPDKVDVDMYWHGSIGQAAESDIYEERWDETREIFDRIRST